MNILHLGSRWDSQRIVKQIVNWTCQKWCSAAFEVCEYYYLSAPTGEKNIKNGNDFAVVSNVLKPILQLRFRDNKYEMYEASFRSQLNSIKKK